MMTTACTLTRLCLFLVVTVGLLRKTVFAAELQQEQQIKSEIKELPTASAKPYLDNQHKTLRVSSTTASLTNIIKQDVKTSTALPTFQLDGRHAIINNEFMADQQPKIDDTTTALYNIIQKQMATIISNSKSMGNLLKDRLGERETSKESLGAPGKPLFAHSANNFNEYDEYSENGEELTEQEEQQTENCEDTEESLTDNDDDITVYGKEATTKHPTNEKANKEQTVKITEKIFHNQNTSTAEKQSTKQLSVMSNDHNMVKQSTIDAAIKKSPVQSHPGISYIQTLLNPEVSRPFQSLQYNPELGYITPLLNRTSTTYSIANALNKPPAYSSMTFRNHLENRTASKEIPYATLQTHKPDGLNNSYTSVASPFSSSSINSSEKKPTKKRNLSFRTMSSSTQFVSTPLGDLMFKLVVGIAKPVKDKEERQKSFDGNDVELNLYK